MQEFHFAHPHSKMKLNRIYNTHFTGSVLWDLFSKESGMIANTWSISIRNIFNLHRQTHRYFIEPISGEKHIKFSLLGRFIRFSNALNRSSKAPLRRLYNTVKRDCSSTTGSNLRQILLLVDKHDVNDVRPKDLDSQEFCTVKKGDEWRIGMAKELIEVQNKQATIECLGKEEITCILDHICTS